MTAKKLTRKQMADLMNTEGKRLYVYRKLNFKEIALELGVDARTISNHAKKGEWEKERELANVTPERIKQMVVEEMMKVSRGETVDTGRIDALSKMHKIYQSLSDDKKNYLAWLDGFEASAKYLQEIGMLDESKQLNKWQNLFVQDVIFKG